MVKLLHRLENMHATTSHHAHCLSTIKVKAVVGYKVRNFRLSEWCDHAVSKLCACNHIIPHCYKLTAVVRYMVILDWVNGVISVNNLCGIAKCVRDTSRKVLAMGLTCEGLIQSWSVFSLTKIPDCKHLSPFATQYIPYYKAYSLSTTNVSMTLIKHHIIQILIMLKPICLNLNLHTVQVDMLISVQHFCQTEERFRWFEGI